MRRGEARLALDDVTVEGRAGPAPTNLRRAVALIALAAFAALAVAYAHDPVAGWDVDVADWVAGDLPAWVEWLARPFSWLGGWIGIAVLSVVASLVLARERAWPDLGLLLTAALGSQASVALLKLWFDRPRPDVDPAIALPSSASFPSGHATAGIATLGAVAVLAAERLPWRRARAWLWLPAVAVGLAVGASRVALGVHYVSDVLAGWCFGIAWLAACLLLRDGVRRDR